ncbi:hypothetical protein BH23GEM4_BH23GEM4_02830 [soil metagenome]
MSGGDPAAAIRRRDEILQVMFWMRGEGLADEAGSEHLRVFLNEADDRVLVADVDALDRAGLLEAMPSGAYRLTPSGVREGGRRFAGEFAELTAQAHGACSDPDCDCQTLGPEACTHAHAH